MKSSDFYCKRHILAWKHVVWAILRECPLRGLTPRAEREKSQKVSDSHRNDVSPLTQGLRYRAACDCRQLTELNTEADVVVHLSHIRLPFCRLAVPHTAIILWTSHRISVSQDLFTWNKCCAIGLIVCPLELTKHEFGQHSVRFSHTCTELNATELRVFIELL